MTVQIYSMTSVPDAVATAEAGADLIGLVIAEPGVVAEAIGADAAREKEINVKIQKITTKYKKRQQRTQIQESIKKNSK